MSMEIEVGIESGLLRVVVRGRFSVQEAKRTFLEVLDAVAQHRASTVLIDGRLLKGKPETMERFYYGEFAAKETGRVALEHRMVRPPRFAYVLNEPMLDPWRFGETVAINRGMRVKAFDNLEDALRWIQQKT